MTDREKLIAFRVEVERLKDSFKVISAASPSRETILENIAKSALCKQLLSFYDSMQKEPASDDLENAAFDYAESCKYDGGEKLLCMEHFKAGAKWQKEQMIDK